MVSSLDEMSDGRIELGLGAGWNLEEHQRHAFAFPDIPTRREMLEEQLQVIAGLWSCTPGWSFEGKHYQVTDSRYGPPPTQRPRPPLITGTQGQAIGVRIAARYADHLNLYHVTPEKTREAFALLDRVCAEIGRDPASITRSVLVGTVVGEDRREVERRLDENIATFEFQGSRDDWRRENEALVAVRHPRRGTRPWRGPTRTRAPRCWCSRTSCPRTTRSSTCWGRWPRIGAPRHERDAMTDASLGGDAAWRTAVRGPLLLPPNPVFRGYRGGDRLRRFRGTAPRGDDNWPEEWVGSTTPAGNPDPDGRVQGRSVVETLDGRTAPLLEVVAAFPAEMLGEACVGDPPGVPFLVKIIALAGMAPVHGHPDATFAREHLGRPHGKAEAWLLLDTAPGTAPWAGIGFQPGIDQAAVRAAIADALHRGAPRDAPPHRHRDRRCLVPASGGARTAWART